VKKFLSFILSIVLIFSLVGCNEAAKEEVVNPENEDVNDASEIDTISDYYPFEKNRLMDYQGKGNEFAEMKSFVEFIDEDLIQIKEMNPGTNFVNVLELKDGVLREVFAEGEFYHFENMLKANRNMDNIILKEPLEVGNSWEDNEGNKVEITGVDVVIETPLKTYKALEVTTNYESGAIKREYYAKGVGFVASKYEDGEFKVDTLLKGIENKGIKTNIRAYYPIKDDAEIRYLNKTIDFRTNDNIKTVLENLFKEPQSDKLLAPISKDTSIKSIDLNRDTWVLNIDFSKELREDMNAGSSYELAVIDSIVNTLGDFYDVEKVYISVEGEPYESGHLQLLEGEYFEVDIEDIEELK
jgi:sporulation and spore germination protein